MKKRFNFLIENVMVNLFGTYKSEERAKIT